MRNSYMNAIIGLLMAAPIVGQRPARGLISLGECDRGTYLASKVGEPDGWSFSVSLTGEITTTGPGSTTPDANTLAELAGDPLFANVTASTTTPKTRTEQSLVDAPGGHCAIGSGLNLLIAGRTTLGDARVEHWGVNAVSGDLQLQASQNYVGRDWGGVAFDASSSRLYLIDAISGDIYFGTWSIALGVLPNVLQLYAAYGSYSGAGAPEELCLRYVADGTGQVPSGGALFVYEYLEEFETGTFVKKQSGVVQTSSGKWWNMFGSWGPKILAESASEGGLTVDVRGSVGKTVELTDLKNANVVGSGVVPSAGVVTITVSSPLVIGHVYEAQYIGEIALFPSSFECIARYGLPESTTSGLTFLGRVGEPDAVIGNPHFAIVSNVEVNPAPSTAGALPGIWMMGNFRDSNGIDPIIIDPLDGQGEVVYPIATLAAEGFVYTDGSGYMQMSIPLANDPALVGAILLTQFSTLDLASPSWLKFSEVIGFTIRDQ